MAEYLIVNGGKKLEGCLDIPTAKNAILPIMAGSILAGNEVVLKNIAKYSDVINMSKILSSLGCGIFFDEDTLTINSKHMFSYEIPDEYMSKIRSSIFLLGALLTRFRRAKVSYPGGCNIGSRPIDLHLKGLRSLNVKIDEVGDYIYCDGSDMVASDVYLDFPSVGATENIIMASVGLKGITKIYNPAREPEIVDLQNFLNAMGCKVFGAGTGTIVIYGVEKFHSCEYKAITDRIIAGTYLIATCICGGNVKLNNCDAYHNKILIDYLVNSGAEIHSKKNCIEIKVDKRTRAIPLIETNPYPNFPTDLQNQMLVLQTVSSGRSVIIENLFENRFNICKDLKKMGANIIIKNNMAIIDGVNSLQGSKVTARDLRGGAGLVLAGLVAKGETIISDVEHIDRGYLSIEADLCKLNAEIKRLQKL